MQYIGHDYLGSITHVIDAAGAVKEELSYNPWNGNLIVNKESPKKSDNSVRTEPISGQGVEIMKGKINDPRWTDWQKMVYVHKSDGYKQVMLNGELRLISSENTTAIHYWYNPKTHEVAGFKFK